MNNKVIVASLSKIANELDSLGKFEEANEVTSVMVKVSQATTGAGSAVAGPGYASSADSSTYNTYMKTIEMYLDTGDTASAGNVYYKGLTELKTPEAKRKFTAQWERAVKTRKQGKFTEEKPETGENLDRWVNKAENIYKAYSTKAPATRNMTDALGLLSDILNYLQEMKFKAGRGTSLESAVQARYDKVYKMMADIRAGKNMPTPQVTTPYSKVTGYPAKDVSPFGTGKRLTGPQLSNQADKEIKGI